MVATLGNFRKYAMTPMRVLILSRYEELGASSRLRLFQYLPALRAEGWAVEVQALISDALLSSKYAGGGYYGAGVLAKAYAARIRRLLSDRTYDVLWLEKEALPWLPASLERALLRGRPYVMDFDDAVFHNYDRHRLAPVRAILGRRIDRLMAGAALVTAGNDYLAARARAAGARWVEFLPTVIDLARYPLPPADPSPAGLAPQPPRIVWIGSPSTIHYLQLLAQPLQALALRLRFRLRVIGAPFELPGVDVECVKWTEASEVPSVAACDIGVMPLLETPWELGKCGYKLIQYMACGLPVVASPVGANRVIVDDGVQGFLAADTAAWEQRLGQLLQDATLRQRMGDAGRQRVEQVYCLQQTGPRLASLLRSVKEGKTCAA